METARAMDQTIVVATLIMLEMNVNTPFAMACRLKKLPLSVRDMAVAMCPMFASVTMDSLARNVTFLLAME